MATIEVFCKRERFLDGNYMDHVLGLADEPMLREKLIIATAHRRHVEDNGLARVINATGVSAGWLERMEVAWTYEQAG